MITPVTITVPTAMAVIITAITIRANHLAQVPYRGDAERLPRW